MERKSYGKSLQDSTTVFITGFPDHFRAKDLYKVLFDYGAIDEVAILSKKDKRGRKYGFVRFFEVADVRRLMLKMDNLFIEGRKLHADLSRFSRVVERMFSREKGVNHSGSKEDPRGLQTNLGAGTDACIMEWGQVTPLDFSF
ncbi:unnamed protein product [Lathyrus sativus]|nr:unnamed protein product [Lathyrus sativus]